MNKLKFDDIEEFTEEKKETQTVSLGTIVEIPIELIDIGENIRNVNEDDESKLRQIGESIKADGQIEPCIVYQQGERYIIKAGSRRYKACMLCDVPTLKCIIDKKFNDEKERINIKKHGIDFDTASLVFEDYDSIGPRSRLPGLKRPNSSLSSTMKTARP